MTLIMLLGNQASLPSEEGKEEDKWHPFQVGRLIYPQVSVKGSFYVGVFLEIETPT